RGPPLKGSGQVSQDRISGSPAQQAVALDAQHADLLAGKAIDRRPREEAQVDLARPARPGGRGLEPEVSVPARPRRPGGPAPRPAAGRAKGMSWSSDSATSPSSSASSTSPSGTR